MEPKLFAKNKLIKYQEEFNPYIKDFLQTHLEKVSPNYIYTEDFLTVLNDVIGNRGGKRGRAAFVNFVYKMYGGTDQKLAFDLAVVIELVHGYLIILDDFMDKSDTRRHGPATHKMFETYHAEKEFVRGDALHFGNSISTLVGVTAFHIAMQLLNELDISLDTRIALSQNINQKVEITAYGQLHDVFNAASLRASEEDVMKMLEWKTGVYTYENPIHSGAILAGITDEDQLNYLSRFAIPAGIAFQIQDDILGVFGNDEMTGKSNLDDLKEGKYTLLVHKALELLNEEKKAILLEALGNEDLTISQHEEVKQLMKDVGALDYCKNKSVQLVVKAKEALLAGKKDYFDQEGFDYLIGISDYMIDRDL